MEEITTEAQLRAVIGEPLPEESLEALERYYGEQYRTQLYPS